MEKEIRIYGVNDFQELKENSWSGAIPRLNQIEENGKEEEFLALVNELIQCSEQCSWTDTELNDFIWFDDEYYFDALGMEWK